MPGIQIGDIATLKTGALKAELFKTALELGIFHNLRTPQSAGDLATAHGLDGQKILLLLEALVGQGWVTRAGELFYSNALSEELHSYALNSMNTPSLVDIMRGNTVVPGPSFTQQAHTNWPIVYGLRGQHAVVLAQRIFSVDTHFRVLDYGCGCGGLGIAIAEAFPHAQVTLVETPEVIAATKNYAEKSTAEKHIQVDTQPRGPYELIIVSGVFYFAESLPGLVNELAGMLSPGGHLFHTHRAVSEDHTQPADFILNWLSTRLGHSGHLFTEKQLDSALAQAGLKETGLHGDGPFPLTDLVIRRSPS